jgi:NitT/TauT family transport system substrate-binding protein
MKKLQSRGAFVAALAAATAGAPMPLRAQVGAAVRIATTPNEIYAQPLYAQETGLFAKAGLPNVDVQVLGSGSAVASAVAGGAADIGVSSMLTIANAVARGLPFTAIAPCALSTTKAPAGVLCVLKSSPIRSPKDFEGKTIAQNSLKTSGDLALHVWFTKNNVDADKVKLVETLMSEMGSGLEREAFAGCVLSDPPLTIALKKGAIRVFADPFQAIAPEQMVGIWFTTQQYAQGNADAVKRVAAALTEAARWGNAHHNESAAIVARFTKVDVETIRSETRPVYGEQLRPALIQPSLDAAFKYGFLPRAVNASEFLPRS